MVEPKTAFEFKRELRGNQYKELLENLLSVAGVFGLVQRENVRETPQISHFLQITEKFLLEKTLVSQWPSGRASDRNVIMCRFKACREFIDAVYEISPNQFRSEYDGQLINAFLVDLWAEIGAKKEYDIRSVFYCVSNSHEFAQLDKGYLPDDYVESLLKKKIIKPFLVS